MEKIKTKTTARTSTTVENPTTGGIVIRQPAVKT
jgi:hypothetical protein